MTSSRAGYGPGSPDGRTRVSESVLNRSTCALALVAALLLVGPARGSDEASDLATPVSDFALTERDGRIVTRDDLLGKVWIASFVLVRCPDGQCPQVTRTMKRLQDELAGRRDLLLVSFTVDPDRDDPAELTRYADAHDADPARWLFLTGKERVIDQLMRSFHLRAGPYQPGSKQHRSSLLLVDRKGQFRGVYTGLKPTTGDSEADEEMFETDLRKLRRHVDQLLAPELPAYLPKDFPAFNATLNALAGALVLLGYAAIRLRLVRTHATCMITALVVSAVFLTSYLFYHLVVKAGQPTRFSDQAPNAPTWVAYLYLLILGSHTLLAIPTAPLALFTAYQGLRGRLEGHVRLARWTLPIWVYVSLTGVVVYWMLYRLYPLP